MKFSRDDLLKMKQSITAANIISFLEELGGKPRYYNTNVIISRTVCHDGDSHKLYYYINTQTFHCYTNCGTFDIFELVRKVFNMEFIQSIYYIINKFSLHYLIDEEEDNLSYNATRKIEEEYFKTHKRITQNKKEFQIQHIELPEFDDKILSKFLYPIIKPWEREGITREVINKANIGYYPGGGQITIPHYDQNNRLIGIRGRQLGQEEAEIFGKYRPLFVNNISYAHPLGFNLYGLNDAKQAIKKLGKAVIFEGEKSVLKACSFFGLEQNIYVATCGSSLSDYQVQLLVEAGAKEICIAFDRQFQEIGDIEFKKLTKTLTQLNKKYKKLITISFIFDKEMITGYKDAPIDRGPNVFLQLFKERVIL